MDNSTTTTMLLVLCTLIAQACRLAIISDKDDRSIQEDDVQRSLDDGRQMYDAADFERNYASLLNNMQDETANDHPFLFPNNQKSYLHGRRRDNYLPRANSMFFHGKRNMMNDNGMEPLDQNTALFHGKRNMDMMNAWISRQQDAQPSSRLLHGKKDGNSLMARMRTRRNAHAQKH